MSILAKRLAGDSYMFRNFSPDGMTSRS
jgi:hypothetical protein